MNGINKNTMLALSAACFLWLPAADALENFSDRSIEGDYVAVAIEQGGGTSMGAGLPEAALIMMKCDGEGGCRGTLLWNMPDPISPTTDRLLVDRVPATVIYGVGAKGFGWMWVTANLKSVGMGQMTIKLRFLITEATPNKIATEMYYIGMDYLPGEAYPVGFMKLR